MSAQHRVKKIETSLSAAYVSCKRGTTRICWCAPCCVPYCCGARRAAIDRYLVPARPTAANSPHAAVAGKWDRQRDVQIDRPTDTVPVCYTDPALHTMWVVPIRQWRTRLVSAPAVSIWRSRGVALLSLFTFPMLQQCRRSDNDVAS